MAEPAPQPAPSVQPPTTAKKSAASRRRWPWWKRGLAILGVLLALLILFHRPLLFGLMKYAARKVGAGQGLKIEFEPGGTIFTGLTLRHLHVAPTRPSPVEKADIGLVQLRYSLWTLLTGGMAGEWLHELTLHDADIVYDPRLAPPAPPKPKQPFKLPALPFPQRVSLQNVNFLLRGEPSPAKAEAAGKAAAASSAVPAPAAPAVQGATKAVVNEGLRLAGLNLELQPDRAGTLHFDELRIPGGPELKNITAGTTYQRRDLRLTDLTLAPQLHFRLLEVDASQLAAQRLGIHFDADLFGGQGSAKIALQGFGVSPKCDVELNIENLALGQVSDFLKLDTPLAGRLGAFTVNFHGTADAPRTWDGQIAATLDALAYGKTVSVDSVKLRALLKDGTADFPQILIVQGANKISLTAKADLPARLNDLPQATARGTLQAELPDVGNLPFEPPARLGGAMTTHGDFTVANGEFKATLKGVATNLQAPGASVGKSEFTLEVSKKLPPSLSAAPKPTPTPKTSLDTRRKASLGAGAMALAAGGRGGATRSGRTEAGASARAPSADENEADDFRLVANDDSPAATTPPTPAPTPTPAAPAAGPKPSLAALLDGLTTNVNLKVTDARYGDYRIDTGRFHITSDGDQVNIQQMDITRGDNHVELHGTYQLPDNPADWRKHPLNLEFNAHAPDLSQFSTDQTAAPLRGQLDAKGTLALKNGQFQGGFDVTGRNLAAKGASVQSIDTHIDVRNDVAKITQGDIQFDDRNHIKAGGEVHLDPPFTYDTNVDITLSDLSRFEPILRDAGINQPLAGSVRIMGKSSGRLGESVPGAGDRLLNGAFDVTGRDISAAGLGIAGVDAHVVLDKDRAIVQNSVLRFDEKDTVGFDVNVALNAPRAFDIRITADLPNLAVFNPALAANHIHQKIDGSARLETKLRGFLAAPAPAPAVAASENVPPSLGANPAPNQPPPVAPPPATRVEITDGFLVLTAREVRSLGARLVQALDGRVNFENNTARVQTFNLRFDEKNSIALDGQASILAPFEYQLGVNANLPELNRFEPLLRALKAAKPKPAAAAAVADTKPVTAPGVSLAEPAVKRKPPTPAPVPPPAKGKRVPAIAANAKIRAERASETANPKPQTPAAPAETRLAGSLQVEWQGSGNFAQPLSEMKYSGTAKVTARGVEYNALGPLAADVAGQYSPQAIDFPTIDVRVNGLELRTTFALKDALARLDNLHLLQGQTDLLAGYAQIPFDLTQLSAPGGPVPDVDKIDVNIASKTIELTTLFAALDKTRPAPAQGTLQLAVTAHGSLSKIAADVKVQARGLRAPATKEIQPADADVDLNLRDDRLNLVASVRQPQIQPLSIKGNVPFDLNKVLTNKALDPQSPVFLVIDLPRSSLGFLAKLSPQIAYVEGTVAADVRVTGTLEKPAFAGAIDLNIPGARARNITFPRISEFAAHLAFTERQVRIERFGGVLGGGKFSASGRVDFPKLALAAAQIDLTIKADDALLFRDDTITGRANADIRVTGPLASATVAGRVGITKSRFLKDIDILPLNLPGKPAPAPPAAAEAGGPQTISIDTPPLRDWKFNLVIKTDDPFLIRGNLANGQALVDLKVEGTGARPLLSGYVQIENLTTTLPFSRLEIQTGNLQFTPDQPLNPVLDVRGTSQIRERLVTVYIFGRARDPQTLFTSEPPLPQAEIVSLLITGATTSELAGSGGQALAGKATLLVLQDLYRRTFKKNSRASAEPQDSLLDRFSFDVGNVDPRTGKQEVTGRFKITRNVSFIGDFGIEGDLRGRVKYLIRFR